MPDGVGQRAQRVVPARRPGPGHRGTRCVGHRQVEHLRRHRTVLQELSAGNRDAPPLAITGWYSTEERLPPRTPLRRWLRAGSRFPYAGARWWRSFIEDDSEPDDLIWTHLFVEGSWLSADRLQRLVREVARGGLDAPHAIIAPADLRWLYHPYDGGADVITPTVQERDALRDRHVDWLSAHPQGL